MKFILRKTIQISSEKQVAYSSIVGMFHFPLILMHPKAVDNTNVQKRTEAIAGVGAML